MFELYRSELSRFRNYAALYGGASFVILAVLQQLMDLANAQKEIHGLLLVFYMLSGIGFALYQFGTYRKPGRWIWLQHRPLHRARILGALVLAALTLIALAVALPLILLLASQEHFTHRVIDGRHYAGAIYLALFAMSAWLAGGYIALHRSRWAFVVLALLPLLSMHLATATTVLMLSLACNALLLSLLYHVFRPNRSTSGDTIATAATALPLQVAFYLALLWGGSILFQTGQMIAGAHPLSSDSVPIGGPTEATRSTPVEAIQAGLAGSADPRAAAWRTGIARHAADGSVTTLRMVRQHTVRNALTAKAMGTFIEGENRWTFSHDRMMYRAVNLRTGTDQGWTGPGGSTGAAFDSQPTVVPNFRGGIYLVTAHDMYEQAGADKVLHHIQHVDGREQFLSSASVLGKQALVLTNQRLILSGGANAQPVSIKLPVPAGDLVRVDAAQVAEGTLVSFVSGYRQLDGVTATPQIVDLVDSAGQVHEVARRELAHDFPRLFEHKDWWLSPALHALAALPDLLVEHGVPSDDGASPSAPLLRERPAGVWFAAMAAALLSAAGAAWWSGRASLTPRSRAVWCLACLMLGLPALLSLMVLQPRKQTERARSASPAPAPVPA